MRMQYLKSTPLCCHCTSIESSPQLFKQTKTLAKFRNCFSVRFSFTNSLNSHWHWRERQAADETKGNKHPMQKMGEKKRFILTCRRKWGTNRLLRLIILARHSTTHFIHQISMVFSGCSSFDWVSTPSSFIQLQTCFVLWVKIQPIHIKTVSCSLNPLLIEDFVSIFNSTF